MSVQLISHLSGAGTSHSQFFLVPNASGGLPWILLNVRLSGCDFSCYAKLFFPAFLVYDRVKGHRRRLTYLLFLQSVVREVTNVKPCLALLMSETGKEKQGKTSQHRKGSSSLRKGVPRRKEAGDESPFLKQS